MTIRDICDKCDNIQPRTCIKIIRNGVEIWRGLFGTLVSEIIVDAPVVYFWMEADNSVTIECY